MFLNRVIYLNKPIISKHQFLAIVVFQTCGTSIIMISSALAGFAKQDSWIISIITPLIGLPFIWIYAALGKLHPDKTFVEIIIEVFGKVFGKIISAAFIFLCLLNVPQITWYVGNFMKTLYMDQTPIYFINLIMILVLIIALLYGLEVIARSFEIYLYIMTGLFIISMVCVLPSAKIENLQPVFENSMIPILKGSFVLSSYMTWPLIVTNMIYSVNVNNIKKARKAYFIGYIWGALLIIISNVMSILVLGATITSSSRYPVYLLAKEINIGAIFTRVEGVLTIVWLLGMFTKTLLYFYGGMVGLSQLLGLKDYKKILLPIGLICLIYSNVVYPDIFYESKWDTSTWVVFMGTFGFLLPMLLLIIAVIKRKGKNYK